MGKTKTPTPPSVSPDLPNRPTQGSNLVGKLTESYLKHVDLHSQEADLAKSQVKLAQDSQKLTRDIIGNMGNMINNEKDTVSILKNVIETIKLQSVINKWLVLLILVFSFHNELLSLWRYIWGLIQSFVGYMVSLWPKMTADGQMATVVAGFSFVLGIIGKSLWDKRKKA